ncbi:MAG TPA: 3-hydroxybutyrate oligomer hydrolase family protein [Burkholderiaceae bacterium]|nr:3-hydroxybutyrate oligomer hydrolase family protein [Burkholderiaceae bacterium]
MTNRQTTNSALIRAARSGVMVAALAAAGAAHASRCTDLASAFGSQLADVQCFESTDLTTNNPATTPMNDSLAGLPPFAFTPITDRGVIAPAIGQRTPITKAVPGLQLDARIASDPTGQARFLLRLPDSWNGRLVVAGASGTRSEFNGDFAWSDYVVQQGYAYASQNKGVLNLHLTVATDPLGCRLNPSLAVYVHFYDNDPGQQFTRWRHYMIAAAKLARAGVEARYGHEPRYTYAVGTSNGGYQVRRAIETAPELFDGGVDWEGTFVDAGGPNLLTDLPPAVLNFPDYVASGYSAGSTAAKNIRAAGYPPDLTNPNTTGGVAASLWGNYSTSFWEVTLCQWQKRLDPTYDTYGAGTGTYNYFARLSVSDVGEQLSDFATTGRIQRPLVTLAGTMDGLLPIDHHARAYARKVRGREGDDGLPPYRLYEVQNGNHIETYNQTFPQLELIEPHAQRAFDLLVQYVENGASLPPDQCIPRGQQIADPPAQPGHCQMLLAP